jgi:hypothetical protein
MVNATRNTPSAVQDKAVRIGFNPEYLPRELPPANSSTRTSCLPAWDTLMVQVKVSTIISPNRASDIRSSLSSMVHSESRVFQKSSLEDMDRIFIYKVSQIIGFRFYILGKTVKLPTSFL